MSLRTEFVLFASQDGANIHELCRRYGISPATAYKWLRRWEEEGPSGLKDRSRAPRHSPNRSSDNITDLLRMAHELHQHWGPARLSAGSKTAGTACRPSAPSTT
ncbi:CP4-6 prophage [Plautia stali symbiont]|nr:CP4-6 prophage [Plautia stali symbiont]